MKHRLAVTECAVRMMPQRPYLPEPLPELPCEPPPYSPPLPFPDGPLPPQPPPPLVVPPDGDPFPLPSWIYPPPSRDAGRVAN